MSSVAIMMSCWSVPAWFSYSGVTMAKAGSADSSTARSRVNAFGSTLSGAVPVRKPQPSLSQAAKAPPSRVTRRQVAGYAASHPHLVGCGIGANHRDG
jgi:hypothetical protein